MDRQKKLPIESSRMGDIDGVKAALAAGANVHATNDAAQRQADLNRRAGIVRMLDADALREAAANGHAEMVNLLLAADANVHANDDEALREAAARGHVEIVSLLLAAGANVHANDDEALRYAAARGHVEIVSLLLAADANVHANNDAALRYAAASGHAEIVSLLLAADANVHANNDAALRYAAASGHAEIVNRLLAAGANPVIALENTSQADRGDVVTTLDACAAVLTSEQRAALLAISRPGEFVQLRAIAASAVKHRTMRR